LVDNFGDRGNMIFGFLRDDGHRRFCFGQHLKVCSYEKKSYLWVWVNFVSVVASRIRESTAPKVARKCIVIAILGWNFYTKKHMSVDQIAKIVCRTNDEFAQRYHRDRLLLRARMPAPNGPVERTCVLILHRKHVQREHEGRSALQRRRFSVYTGIQTHACRRT
jgi:hypothetical protein